MTFTDSIIALKMVLAYFRQRPTRLLLTIVSTVTAAAIVVFVVSGYDSLESKFADFSDNYLGRYELILLPVNPEHEATIGRTPTPMPPLPQAAIDAIRSDPATEIIDPVFQSRPRMTKVGGAAEDAGQAEDAEAPARKKGGKGKGGGGYGGGRAPGRFGGGRNGGGPTLVGTDATQSPYTMLEGKWIDPKNPERLEAVVSRGLAAQLKLALGDELKIAGDQSTESVKVIGIAEQRKALPTAGIIMGLPSAKAAPLPHGPAASAVYVPMALAKKLSGDSHKIDFAGVILKTGYRPEAFRAKWQDKLSAMTPPIELQSLSEIDGELNQGHTADTVKAQAYSATGIALLAALFIIFTTLGMGVDERIRQFAILRAVAFTKAQIAMMIAFEALFLGIVGWAGGLLAGSVVLSIVTRMRPDVFPVGSSLGAWCIGLSGLCALGGSLAASILPAWKATRVSPLDAMTARAAGHPTGIPWLATILGLALVTVNPIVVFLMPMPDSYRAGISAVIGCTAMAIGFVLLAPLAVIATERILGPVVARLLGLDPMFLATQLSSNLWRSLGTTVALTLGLGLYIAMQVWGHSMMSPFLPGDWAPELFVSVPSGIPDDHMEEVRHIKGVVADQCIGMVSEQIKFGADILGTKIRHNAARQDNCTFVGIDPDAAIGGNRPTLDFRYVDGSREEALAKLKTGGRYSIVPDHFARESGLKVGDKFPVLVSDSPGETVDYEIAGVASMDGWHFLSKGIRGGNTAGLMFSPIRAIRKDFSSGNVRFFWMNLEGPATVDEVKEALRKIAAQTYDPNAVRGKGGRGGGRGKGTAGDSARSGSGSGPTVTTRTATEARDQVANLADGILWLFSRLPLVTLLVTSLGVMNTVISSVRARRWEIGVMRAVGVTRFGIFRMVVAEALLVGLASCVMSLAFGAVAGYCGTGVTRYVNFRGGMIVPLVLPWAKIAIGFVITLGLCLLAALWPAVTTGRTETLRLLQAGRTAM